MAFTFDAVGPSGGGGQRGTYSTAPSWSHVVGSGTHNIVIVFATMDRDVGFNNSDTVRTLACTIAGSSATDLPGVNKKQSGSDAETVGYIQAWYATDVATGSQTITVTPTGWGGSDHVVCGSISLTADGALSISSGDVSANNSKTDPLSKAVTSDTSKYVFAGECDGAPTAGVASGATARVTNNVGSQSAAGGLCIATQPGAATVTITWSTSGDWHAGIYGSVTEAGGGGGPTVKKLAALGVG